MATALYYCNKLKGVTVNAPRGATSASFDSTYGLAVIDLTDTDLVAAIEDLGADRIQCSVAAAETVTDNTVQTATTCSGLYLCNGAAETTIHIHNTDGTGTLLTPLITLAANVEAVIMFPEPLVAAGGIFIETVTGGLAGAGNGFLIP